MLEARACRVSYRHRKEGPNLAPARRRRVGTTRHAKLFSRSDRPANTPARKLLEAVRQEVQQPRQRRERLQCCHCAINAGLLRPCPVGAAGDIRRRVGSELGRDTVTGPLSSAVVRTAVYVAVAPSFKSAVVGSTITRRRVHRPRCRNASRNRHRSKDAGRLLKELLAHVGHVLVRGACAPCGRFCPRPRRFRWSA